MSEPRKHKHPLHGAQLEIIAGLSALHMEPLPIPADAQESDHNGYLTDVDHWARHAEEHFHQAYSELGRALQDLEALRVDIADMIKVYREPELQARLLKLIQRMWKFA